MAIVIGGRYWLLTVKKKTDKRVRGYVVYECECSCGNSIELTARELTTGRSKTCGCVYVRNIVGQRSGSAVALEPVTIEDGVVYWLVEQDGERKVMSVDEFRELGAQDKPLPAHDLTGVRIGDIEVLGKHSVDAYRNARWLVQTPDGEKHVISRERIRLGGDLGKYSWTSEDYRNAVYK